MARNRDHAVVIPGWMMERLAHLRRLKAPNHRQRLLLLLADKQPRTADDERKLLALVRAEKVDDKLRKTRKQAARIVSVDKRDRMLALGAAALKLMEVDQQFREEMLAKLSETLTRPADRALFGLDAKEEPLLQRNTGLSSILARLRPVAQTALNYLVKFLPIEHKEA